MSHSLLIAFVIFATVMFFTPGPNNIMLLSSALTYGFRRTVPHLVGIVIGFYDGFFGPGTGSFLIFIFIGLFGFDFLSASASAKVINFATNLSAVIYFSATRQILYQYAVPMGLCNLLGSLAGSRLAILKGNAFVRVFFLAVVAVRLLQLRELGRERPEERAVKVVDKQMIEVLRRKLEIKKEAREWTVLEFWRAVARPGGFIGRKSDGQPGWQTLWGGWQRLQDLCWTIETAH